MAVSISTTEKIEIFLALSSLYDSDDSRNSEEQINDQKIKKLFQAIPDNKIYEEVINERIDLLENISNEQRELWQKFWLEKLKKRGITNRLDENIHPDRIIELLEFEPKAIQKLIYKNLPKNIANTVLIQIFDDFENSNRFVHSQISQIIRNNFLSNFVAFDDIFQVNVIDNFSASSLENFIQELGVREMAIYCRGIKTKENLAVFLKPFGDEATKKIAEKLVDLKEIDSKRVVIAEKIISRVFQTESKASEKLRNVGINIFSVTFANRDQNSKRFTEQKLSLELGSIFNEYISAYETDKPSYLNDLRDEILEIAESFMERE